MPQPDLPAEGRCRCGDVVFRITEAPLVTMACHCRGCQRMSAGPYSLSALVPESGFALVSGAPVPGGADPGFGHEVCPRCATWLWTRPKALSGVLLVRATLFDDVSWIAPYVEVETATRLPFAETGAALSYPGFPPPDAQGEIVASYAAWARGA